MNIQSIYRLASQEYLSNIDTEEINKKILSNFNLNHQRPFLKFFAKENSDYEGIMRDGYFEVRQNEAIRSTNDGIYLFFTQIVGYISEEPDKTIIIIHAEISKQIRQMLLAGTFIYLIILFFVSLSLGIFLIFFSLSILLWARKEVKKDFEKFKQEFQEKVLTAPNTSLP